jgi:tetratricopeptide (TPR) repeat protein
VDSKYKNQIFNYNKIMTNPEEKNENTTLDVNSNAENNSADKNESDSNKSENNLDSEDTLDVNQEEKGEAVVVDEKQSRTIRTLVIAVVLLLPIIYIFYKTMGNTSAVQEPVASNPQTDIAAYENAATTNPTVGNLLNLSNAYIRNRMAAKALEPLNKVLSLDPNNAVAYSNLGFAYTILQNYKKGVEYGEKAVQLDSTYQLAKNNLNWERGEQKKILDVIEELGKTPEKDRTTFYYLNLGLNYLKVQEYDKGIEVWNKILVTDPKNAGALINIGVAYMAENKYDNAIKSFEKSVEYNPGDQLSKNNLAWALGEKKKADELEKSEGSQKLTGSQKADIPKKIDKTHKK